MGLLKAGIGALGGVLADQWRDYFYCEAMDADILAVKGQKRKSERSSNKKGDDNIISNGSIIAVNDGQCVIITEQGKVVEICAEPGEFLYDTSSEPSMLFGGLKLKETFSQIKSRFTFGGDTGKDQRVYYFNTKEIIGNKYGTPSPIPFRVVDKNIGLDMDIALRCHGEYSYKITNPVLFYENVCGNVEDEYSRENIDSQLKSELMTALQPAFAKISNMGIRYSSISGHTLELADALNEVLSGKWGELRGIEIVSMGVSSVKASEEDEAMIKELQRNAVFQNPTMAAAHMVGAQAQAMQDAANNAGGAMTGFMGFNMAQGNGGRVENLYEMGEKTHAEKEIGWKCSCGHEGNSGKFCSECGAKKTETDVWICSCGKENSGKFCSECGKARGGSVCPKCGWKASGESVKFCPECGEKLN